MTKYLISFAGWAMHVRQVLLLLAVSGATVPVIADPVRPDATSAALDAAPMNTFRYIGNALVCKTDTLDGLKCLRIGRVKLGDSYEAVRNGQQPWKEVSLPDGATASVFPIVARDDAKAYWVIGHRHDRVVSVQLTGNFAHPELAFSTIQLTDPEQKVKEVLGPRYAVREVSEVEGVLWDYAPFPFTIEIVKGRVYSMRVALSENPLQPTPESSAAERAR